MANRKFFMQHLLSILLTWDQGLFSFRFENHIPALRECMRTAKIGPDLRLRFYQRGSSINRRGFIIARATTEAVQNVDECLSQAYSKQVRVLWKKWNNKQTLACLYFIILALVLSMLVINTRQSFVLASIVELPPLVESLTSNVYEVQMQETTNNI